QQGVPASEHRHDHLFDHRLLADDPLADLVTQPSGGGQQGLGVGVETGGNIPRRIHSSTHQLLQFMGPRATRSREPRTKCSSPYPPSRSFVYKTPQAGTYPYVAPKTHATSSPTTVL